MGVTHLLDYGCGHNCTLARSLKLKQKLTYQAYDPGVAKFAKAPFPAEMVACVDVLEHIEPDKLEDVLDNLRDLAQGIVFLTVDTGPAMKSLDDGRNAHLIQEPMQWWLPKLWDRWELQTVQMINHHQFIVVGICKSLIENAKGEMIA